MDIGVIKKQVSEAMRLVSGSAQPVFLRTIAVTGGDVLLGIKGTETATDVEIDPKPLVGNVSERQIAMSNGRLLFGDAKVVFPPGIALATIQAATVVIGSKEYRVVQVDAMQAGGGEVMATAVIRPLIQT